jgi:mRNA interferase YafQ
MLYEISYTNRFRKDLRKCNKQNLDIDKLSTAIKILQSNGTLPSQYKPHKLRGSYDGLWECHLSPNWLMVWKQDDKKLTLLFMYTGTHSELF